MKNILKYILFVLSILVIVLCLNWITTKDERAQHNTEVPTSITADNTTEQNIDIAIDETASEIDAEDEKCGQVILPLLPQENPEDYFEREIEIPRVLEADENGVISVTEPRSILNTNSDDPEEWLERRKKDFASFGVEIVEAKTNDDKSVTFVFTEPNLELYISAIEDVFNRRLQTTLHNKVSVNKEFNKLYIYVDEETHGGDFGYDLYLMEWHMIFCQIYSGVPNDEWNIVVDVINTNTGEVILEYDFYETNHGFEMTSEEWEQLFE